MVLIIDNYDSFVYNLACYVKILGYKYKVIRNDELSISDLLAELNSISHIIISPGPGKPDEAGLCMPLLNNILSNNLNVPLLGVCLGHQALGVICGAKLVRQNPMHGKTSKVKTCVTSKLFTGITDVFTVARYHSLVIDKKSLLEAKDLKLTATTLDDNLVMSFEHTRLPLYGVQFHPESILSEHGKQTLLNFLSL